MLYNNEDEFLKLLADKISQVTPKQPTNGDWASFDKTYRAHKQINKKRKMGVFIWFSIFTVSFFGFYAIYLNSNVKEQTSIVKTTENKEIIKNEVEQTPLVIDIKTEITAERILKNKTKVTNKNKPVASPINKQITQKNIVERDNSITRNESNDVKQISINENNNHFELIKNWNEITLLESNNHTIGLIDPQFISIENKTLFSNKINALNTSLVKNEITNIKGKLKVNLAYMELGYLLQSNVYKQLNNSNDQFFNGIGAKAGLQLSNNWSLNFGLSALFLNLTELNKSVFKTTEKHIESIDTTIKYNAFYKRLMMQIDTVTSEKSVDHQTENSYQNNVAFYNLPIEIRYQLGNEKRGVYGALGVTGTVVYQLETNVKNIGLVNETSQTNNNYQLLFAPTMGVGAYQKLYNNWALHISANYLKYLNGSIYKPNTLQIQTGLKYNF